MTYTWACPLAMHAVQGHCMCMGAHSEAGRLGRGAMCSRRCVRWSSTPSGRGVPRPRSRVGPCSLSDVGDSFPAGWWHPQSSARMDLFRGNGGWDIEARGPHRHDCSAWTRAKCCTHRQLWHSGLKAFGLVRLCKGPTADGTTCAKHAHQQRHARAAVPFSVASAAAGSCRLPPRCHPAASGDL